MKKRWLWWAGAGALVVLGLLWWRWPAATPIGVVRVEKGELRVTVVNTRAGTIKSCQRAGLSLPGGGVVEQIAVKAGERVEQGQLLLSLWRDDSRAELARAQAELALGRIEGEERCTEAEFYRREAARLATLLAKNLTSRTLAEQAQNLADTRRFACQGARQQVQVRDALVAQAQAKFDERALHAPFAGVVAEVNSRLGEYMTPSPPGIAMPPVIDLIDDRCLYVSAPIDEVDAARLRLGQSARVLLDAMPGRDLAATLTRIAPYVKEQEKQARTVEVEARLDKLPSDMALLVGYSADLEVEIAREEETLRIPVSARAEDGSVLHLADGRLERLTPVWGLENWNWIAVKDGLTEGEVLVAQPSQIQGKGPYREATNDE